MTPMRVAITQRVIENTTYPERRDGLAHDWMPFVRSIIPDATVVPVPNHLDDITAWLNAIEPEALILTGGNDWGEACERDHTEIELVHWFREHEAPILGVCRGLQVLNIIFGGQLCTRLGKRTQVNHVASKHTVGLKAGIFQEHAGYKNIMVNSYHNHAVIENELASDLIAFALAEDRVVEGCVHRQEAILALQWHPERDSPSASFDRKLAVKLFSQGAFWTSQ